MHGYINLSSFELKIIDTASFQRLKDVRQLTCQDVYPCARHTRFEHSLGVLELTKQAIKYLNKNGFIDGENPEEIISKKLEFNGRMAALLHDIGHCPFSHLGETQFAKKDVRAYLYELLKDDKFKISDELKDKFSDRNKKYFGAVHEQLSCIVILEKYYDLLSEPKAFKGNDESGSCNSGVEADFELIIRCILGIEYDVSTKERAKENFPKNSIIRLINSNIFDMDKLDYIMRDSFYTGIGTPTIDTNRLFKNMYFDKCYELIFTSRAVPVLQNMIDSRDGLYMYVYNHHAVVLSDFIYAYIIRKLSHNAGDFVELLYPSVPEEERECSLECLEISALGLVPRSYLFSVKAITEQKRSDSDWISLLNIIYFNKRFYEKDTETSLNLAYEGIIDAELDNYNAGAVIKADKAEISKSAKKQLFKRIEKTFELIESHKNRNFLKPWWKTVFEFTSFMLSNFQDDKTRKQLGKWICSGGEYGMPASEFRSQIAKHVIYITQELYKSHRGNSGIIKPFEEGDFFVVERSNRFFSIDTIQKLNIALKTNEIIELSDKSVKKASEYFIKTLTSIIPQKDYSAIYAKEGFYVFSKKLSEGEALAQKHHYEMVEKIFVFVAKEFINRGEQDFIDRFCVTGNIKKNERASMKEMSASFIKHLN